MTPSRSDPMHAFAVPPLLVLFLAGAEPAPAPRPAAAPTRVAGPLDAKGRVDYEGAVNRWLADGVTPENNANVLLVAALGPAPAGDALSDEYFRRLGVSRPPAGGNYFVRLDRFGKETLKLGEKELAALHEQQGRASRRPWKAADHPSVAAWLTANEKPLALVVEATRRPGYYNPLVTRPEKDGEPGWLIGALLPTVARGWDLRDALTARAMLRAGEGKYDDAWADVLACHRLGRLLSRGGTLLEALIGRAVDRGAADAALAWLAAARPTGQQVRARLNDLRELPTFRPAADIVDHGERCTGLDSLAHILRGGPDGTATPAERAALEKLDRGEMEAVFDGWYDRAAGALRLTDRAAREVAFDRLDAEGRAGKRPPTVGEVVGLVTAGDAKPFSRKLARVLAAMLAKDVRRVQEKVDLAEQVGRNLEVAFALAAYRVDEGRYPGTLADLAPRYLPAVPDDVFAGKPPAYRPDGTGYLLYSVGPDGRDGGGRGADDDPPGDDLRVRMPLPAPKKN
ncbi:MAG: hypothetical protein C0501_22695 [Isosphaera sp.]|nr:hypothetical protein [Isosphaera sp.]